MNKKMSHKPKTNVKYPSFSFIDYSTTNHTAKQKIIWTFSYSVTTHNHNSVGKQNKHSCDICNKVFTSNKALNGHMRFHSQKGITNTPTAAPSSIDDQFLPPKKRLALRRKRYCDIDDELTAAAENTLNHSGAKRQKIMDLNELPSDEFEDESN